MNLGKSPSGNEPSAQSVPQSVQKRIITARPVRTASPGIRITTPVLKSRQTVQLRKAKSHSSSPVSQNPIMVVGTTIAVGKSPPAAAKTRVPEYRIEIRCLTYL